MTIKGTFKDLENNTITVTIYNKENGDPDIEIDESTDIRFSDDPVVIKTETRDLFKHVIGHSCTINLVTKRWLGDYLFASKADSIVVNVYRGANECLFAGFVVPSTYNQDYSHDWDEMSINCIDYLSALQYHYLTDDADYESLKLNSDVVSFMDIFTRMKLNQKGLSCDNFPVFTGSGSWVETGWEKVDDKYYLIESLVYILDANAAVDTGERRRGAELTPSWIQSQDTMVVNGVAYYKTYAWVTVNGQQVNTGDYVQGDPVPIPDVDPTIPQRFEPTGVIRVAYHQYFVYGRYWGTLTNGEEVILTDGVGDQLDYTITKASAKHIIKDDTTDTYYWQNIPFVTYDGERYYFAEDMERGDAVGTYDIEGKTSSTVLQRVSYNTTAGQELMPFTIQEVPDEEGNYYFYATLPSTAKGLKNGFKDNTHLKAVVYTKHFNSFDIVGMYCGCVNLEYAYVDSSTITLSGTAATYPFHNCSSIYNLVWKVDPLFTDEVPNTRFINDLPSFCYIYVPGNVLVDYRAMDNFKNYTILKI